MSQEGEPVAGGPAMTYISRKMILQKPLGPAGVPVPEIGFGTWNYSGGVEPLRGAIDRGAAFIDTAESYGTEEIVGEAIRGRRREVFLATKARAGNFRRKDVIRAAEGSLRRLGTGHLDLYQLHWPNYSVPIEETMAGMADLVESGKIRFIGVSNFSVAELRAARKAAGKHPIVSNQVSYSLIERTIEDGLLGYCRENRITVVAYSPFGTTFSALRARDPEGVLARLAVKRGKTEAQVALNWLIAKEGVVAIPKASTVAHVAEDCGASGWRLDEDDVRTLSEKIRFRRRGPVERAARRWARRVLQRLGKSL